MGGSRGRREPCLQNMGGLGKSKRRPYSKDHENNVISKHGEEVEGEGSKIKTVNEHDQKPGRHLQ